MSKSNNYGNIGRGFWETILGIGITICLFNLASELSWALLWSTLYCRLRTTYCIGQIVHHFHFKHAIIIRRPFCFVMLLFGFSIELYLNLFAIFVISKQTVIFSFFTFIVFFLFLWCCWYFCSIFFFFFLEKFSYNNIL